MMATLQHSAFSSRMHRAQKKVHFNCFSYVLNWLLVPLSILEEGFLYSAGWGRDEKYLIMKHSCEPSNSMWCLFSTSSNPHPCAFIFLLDSPLFFSKAHHRKSFGVNVFRNVDVWVRGWEGSGMGCVLRWRISSGSITSLQSFLTLWVVSYWVSEVSACGLHPCV